MNVFEQFTNLYPVIKTLRFELKPIGKTLENIEKKGLIAQDDQRAQEYEKVKDIIDRYHKQFIKMCLYDLKLKLKSDGNYDSLEEYIGLISQTNRNGKENKLFDKIKENLRKQIVEAFKNGGSYKDLFKKKLIQNHLINVAESDEEKAMIENFQKFTTYFNGFNENRKNMYSDEAKSTAIAYRLINENLPMFYDNMRSFEKIANSEVATHFSEIESAFQEYLNVEHINEMFHLDYFTEVLTQEQIDVYNGIIGGRSTDNKKLQGINKYVNHYNQQQKDKKQRIPMLKPLYKMILSDRTSISWQTEGFGNDNNKDGDTEMIEAINEAINTLRPILSDEDKDKSLKYLLQHIGDYDLSRIYIPNDSELTNISKQIFGQYEIITIRIKNDKDNYPKPTKKEEANRELYDERINKLFKAQKSFNIAYLNKVSDGRIDDYFAKLGAFDRNGEQRINLFTQIELASIAATDILAGKHTNLNQSETDIKLIKDLLDAFKALQHFIKPLLSSGDEADKDNAFDAKLHEAWDALDMITPLYNKVRAWLTRKPYCTEKIKLNFENNGTLLGGWVDSKTEKSDNGTQYGGYIFRKKNSIDEYDFYLGISADTKLFCKDESIQNDGSLYERLDYYQVKSQTIFGASYKGCYKDDANNLFKAFQEEANNQGLDHLYFRKDEETIIAYLKRIKATDYQTYCILLNAESVKDKYSEMKQHILSTLASLNRVPAAIEIAKRKNLDIDELFDEITNIPSKSFGFFPVRTEKIVQATERNKKPLFLFKISNKDLSYAETHSKGLRKSRGTDNLHTMYFKALLSMIQGTYDIGTGDIFFRKQTQGLAESTTVHKANQAIKNKNKANYKVESCFKYNIIKDRKYTCDKFLFHLSIIANYNAPKKVDSNRLVHDIIRQGEVQHIIGIDRGERHLLYLSLIDLKGNIVKQFTLNDIVNEYNGQTYTTNYKDLLVSREGDRQEARRNWQKIENIKEIKEGYLSQVVHIIAKMMVEYKAIVVLEDLNMGFMRGRQKIERQVYEKFEKMLIDKLNCYVDKQKDADNTGGLLHPLQLTSEFKSFRELGKQSGWLFYIPAWNTSKIDPVTGFVNMLDTRYENADKARLFFSKFDSIRYNEKKSWFEFSFNYDNFTEKAKGTKTRWTLCTHGTRIRTFHNPAKNNQWDSEEVVLTDAFKKIFADARIEINSNLKNAICSLTKGEHLKHLMRLMSLLLQMRNSKTGTEIDYLLSPVADANGNFYDSRNEMETLPKDADANGAYNIARKGLWVIRKIQSSTDKEKPNLAISNKEWLQFAQQKPYLDE